MVKTTGWSIAITIWTSPNSRQPVEILKSKPIGELTAVCHIDLTSFCKKENMYINTYLYLFVFLLFFTLEVIFWVPYTQFMKVLV
jgi:hypothetical protein